ncbi:MAG: DNA translocase FtsK 4TM domain-containing protein, partial [Candidatus Eisenbacteria bacterium]|nr:DNA translocase FtsK 4TM domain-containing protein [Candidatus Eisenbacteria bacterium]
MASAISSTRQRQILALLLGAFAVLSLASVATYRAPLPFARPWTAANACGPVGATLAWSLIWTVGRMAAFGMPLLAGAWAWNRLLERPIAPLVLRSLLASLIVFEACTLFGLGGLERAAWAGGWGLAAALALRSALGGIGSWVVGAALLGVTVLAASELGFHWLAPLLRGAFFAPIAGAIAAWRAWREGMAKSARPQPAGAAGAAAAAAAAKKPRARATPAPA